METVFYLFALHASIIPEFLSILGLGGGFLIFLGATEYERTTRWSDGVMKESIYWDYYPAKPPYKVDENSIAAYRQKMRDWGRKYVWYGIIILIFVIVAGIYFANNIPN